MSAYSLSLLRILVTPILRFCLRHAIGVYELLETIKSRSVELAVEELKKRGERVTVSRVHVMTGVHRRDIKSLLSEKLPPPPASRTLLSRVLGLWEQSPDFTTLAGKPRVLSYLGEESEFRRLVLQVSSDVNPMTLLAELERIGAVRRDKSGLHLIRAVGSYAHDLSPEKALELLSRDMDTIVQSVEQNLEQANSISNHHIRTEYDNIYPDDLLAIRAWLKKYGNELHHNLRGFLAQHDQDVNPLPQKAGGAKVVFVSYSWTTPLADAKVTTGNDD